MRSVIVEYDVEHPEREVVIIHYEADDLKGGLIIDITAEQIDDSNILAHVEYGNILNKTILEDMEQLTSLC